ncbi:helix-turn-helix domain-containing protein [Roseospira goensis]|uniref:DNA-binding NarL/FixJ family response regulator n=1 Tax=Roseospira goensis TaxID=391922 RepID=A0A7W6S3Y5_9PROT|nr:helix-turn-helix domain-containing protein [Roseospira goensis]MBB4287727.1 DNA-binding NarL/FixJ family response regulator [Roseospira goensis]
MARPPTLTALRARYGPIPAVLLPVVEVAGEEAMLRLVHTLGGLEVTVPAPSRVAGSDLHHALGVPVEVAAVVARRLRDRHGLEVTVPRMAGWLSRQRQARIVALRADGRPIQDIAQVLGITERTVYLALARERDGRVDDRQLDLFCT